MNEMKIVSPSVVGSSEAVKALAEKDRAKILVVSDTHGNYDVLEDVVKKFGPDCDALFFCGDGVCDFEMYFKYAAVEQELKNALPSVVAFARGNGDAAAFRIPSEDGDKNLSVQVLPSVQLTIAKQTVLAIHGHQLNVYFSTDALEHWATPKKAAAVFYGHTHIPDRNYAGKTLVLNPGSAARPRSSAGPTIAVVSINANGETSPTFFSAL